MTLKRLNVHLRLVQKLKIATELLLALNTVSDHQFKVEINDLEAEIKTLKEEIRKSEIEVLPFVSGIQNPQTRMIFRLRFVHGMGWDETARMIGGKNTANGVKAVCYRYLSSCDAM